MIPQFKNTTQALNFGKYNVHNKEVIAELKKQRVILQERTEFLLNAGRLNESLLLASGQCQFVREALDEINRIKITPIKFCPYCDIPLTEDEKGICFLCKEDLSENFNINKDK